jgi:hypothetical protein
MHVEVEVLAAVVTKSSSRWDMTPYSPVKVNRCFGETCQKGQGRRVRQARNRHEADSK